MKNPIRFLVIASVASLPLLASVAYRTPGGAQDASAAPAGVTKATVTVEAKGFRNKKGHALFTVFKNKSTWLEMDQALHKRAVPISNKALMTQTFEGLKPGKYGFSVLHDEDKDGDMTMQWFPIPWPKEGAAASQNPRPKLGPPSWKQVVIPVKPGESTVKIKLWY